MADIVYLYGGIPYINLTNKCPCNCEFCIRQGKESLGTASTLWFQEEPTFGDVKSAIDKANLSKYKEVVFCGYGEPTNALDLLVKTAKYIKDNFDIKIRLNTNGLSDLINSKKTASFLKDNFDTISISLNASTPQKYLEITKNIFGLPSYEAMLSFAKDCKKLGIHTVLSIVDVVDKQEIEDCQRVADSVGIPLRIREYTDNN